MAQVKEREGGGVFLALVSFLARPKPKVPFLGLSSLRNQTETFATQATISLDPRTLYRLRPSFSPLLLSCSLLDNTTLLTKQRTVTSIFCCLIRKSVGKCCGSWVVGRGRRSWVWVWVNVVGKKMFSKKDKN